MWAGCIAGASKDSDKKWRQADTNIMAVTFDQLTNPSNMHTGDAVSCQRCHAIMSHLSTIKDSAGADEKVTHFFIHSYSFNKKFDMSQTIQ